MNILDIIFGKPHCTCCSTTENVREHGYAELEYCDTCAIANGYKIYTDEDLKCHCRDIK